MNFVN